MGGESAELLSSLVQTQLTRASREVPTSELPPRRGEHLRCLVRAWLERLTSEHSDLVVQARSGDADAEKYAVRGLHRLLQTMESVLPQVLGFLREAGRSDVPVAVSVVIDQLIEALLPDRADPVVHVDEVCMYATLDLGKVGEGLGVSPQPDRVPPVVFFMPALDPFSALLLPLIVHEVGHTAIRQAGLVGKVVSTAKDDLNAALGPFLTANPSVDPKTVQIQLLRWMEELLCDALGVLVGGPSYLFASCVFFPVTAEGSPDQDHPYPNDRIRLMLKYLDGLGWGPALSRVAPTTTLWLRKVTAGGVSPGPGSRESFLRTACAALEPHVLRVAEEHASARLRPADFDEISDEMSAHLALHVPPSEIRGCPLSPWLIVLAGWQRTFVVNGDAPAAMAAGVNDYAMRDGLLWAIEAARVAELWRRVPNA